MIGSLLIASGMVIATVIAHFAGLLLLLRLLGFRGHGSRAKESLLGQGLLIIVVMLGIFAIHTVEIWLYAALYFAAGAFGSFEEALYYSTTSFTSVGFGDVVLTREWRILGAIEAANGLILIAWSTAFLISLMSRLRSLEHDWLEGSKAP